jgi:hypothetical protein
MAEAERQQSDRARLWSRRAFQGSCAGATFLLLFRQDIASGTSASHVPDLRALELAQDSARRNVLCSPSNALGVGLRGEYFDEVNWQGARLLTRVDPVVDFDASLDWPAGEARRPLSARWTGWIKAPISGSYRFHVDASGARVVVALQTLSGEGAPPAAEIKLDAGRFYPVSIEIARLGIPAGKRVTLEWTAPYGARFLVPRALLHLPTETASTTS